MKSAIQLELPKGIIRLVPLLDGKLLIAQKVSGSVKPSDVIAGLKRIGITEGLLTASIELLQREDIDEIPVACAYYHDEPPEFNVHFGREFNQTDYLNIVSGDEIPFIKQDLQVLANQKLVSVVKPFRTVLRYPDSRIEEKAILENIYDLRIFNGANVRAKDSRIFSQIEGSAYISRWGKVHVYPILTVRGLGEIHGKLDDQYGVHVLEDIHSYSNLELPSSVFVTGMIHSSYIKAKGYVQALEGIDNSKKIENSRIIAGKSVLAPHIKRYRIMAGEDVLANEIITQSLIISHRNVVARIIDESEIRVQNQLIADEIRAGSQVYLGPSFVKNEAYLQRVVANNKAEKRLARKEYAIEEMKDKLVREKQALIGYFSRLKESGKENILMDATMMRLYNQLKETFGALQGHIKEYESLLKEYLSTKIILAYNARENRMTQDPQIRVYGKIARGVMISTPNRSIKLSKPLDNVTIRFDRSTGEMVITNHKNEQQAAAVNV